mmetsp:Transcript_21172/g.44313  ORF Transcript_21172/g.44313 Transcript_21172/m.44313 type:complete len:323 (-) Transcript_21172:81-1049(-)
MELVETEKDRPKEGPHATPEFEDTMTKTAALCIWMTKPIWGTKRVCLLDSGFGYMSTLPELKKKGIYGTTVLKQKGVGWPKGSDSKNILRHMQGKEVGYQAVCKGSNPDYPDTRLWVASMADSKHTSTMVNTWSTTLPKAKRKRRVGGRLVEINYSEYMHWYYFGRHAVDDNNNNLQGRLSFEETFTPNRWELRHLGWLLGLVQVNSMLAFNTFHQTPCHAPSFTKAAFTRKIANDLVCPKEETPVSMIEGYEPPITRGLPTLPKGEKFKFSMDPNPNLRHRLCSIVAFHGKWNGSEFSNTLSRYPKSHCKACKKETRTFCY